MSQAKVSSEWVREVRAGLTHAPLPAGDRDLVDLISELEALQATASAVQAELAVALDRRRREEDAAAGVPAERRGRGVATEVALARRESPHRGGQFLSLARIVRSELPHTFARWREGTLAENRVQVIAKETACLERADREAIDSEICSDPATLAGLGTAALVGRVRRRAQEADPVSAARRAAKAESERSVTIRPAPDTMVYLTALLPVAQGVAAYAALKKEAEAAKAAGSLRGLGQLMADSLVSQVAGVEDHSGDSTDPTAPPAVPLTLNVVLSDAALMTEGHEPGQILAEGIPAQPVPASVARLLTSRSLHAGTETWIRRLYADPEGQLVGMTSRRRCFSGPLAEFLALRDQGICQTPYCDAPIRQLDHIQAAASGGETSADNGQGLCARCNLAKERTGWRYTRSGPPDRFPGTHLTTPSGHTHHSRAPAAPRPAAA